MKYSITVTHRNGKIEWQDFTADTIADAIKFLLTQAQYKTIVLHSFMKGYNGQIRIK